MTASYSGFDNGDSSTSLTTQPTLTTTATASSHVSGSPYTITATGAVDSNYSIAYVSGTLTVTPATLTITANSQTKAYGAALPTLTVSYSGFVNGDTSASLTTLPTVTTTATTASHVSGNPYSITASGASDAPSGAAFLGTAASYNVYVSGNMSENGGSAATSIAVGGNASITQFSLTGVSGTSLTVGGNLISTGTQVQSGNAQVGGTVTMGTNDNAALVSGATLFYGNTTGNTFPSFPIFNITHVASGGIPASLFSGANASLTSASSALASQPQNGTVTFAFGTLTLTGSNTSTNYFNVSGANLASTSSMQISVPSGATVFINVSGVTDQFSGASISISGTSASKVLFNFYQATSVTLAGIELKGSLLAPTATLFASGGQTDGNVIVAGINVTNGFSYQNSALFTGNSPGAADYTINYVAGALTVTPVALTISAANQTSVYGAALPVLTATYSGFVNGDTSASLTTQPTLTTTATSGSHVSNNPYSITASSAVDTDYSISYAAGTFTVTPAPLTITAVNKSKVYGAVLPTLTLSYTGLVNGDTAASFTILPTVTTTATNSSHVSGSPYTITASGAVDSDYSISYAAGSLTVTPAPLTITALNATKAYGAVMPTLAVSYTGLVNGDTASSLTTPPTLSSTATASSHVAGSPYTVTASGAVDSDYSISYAAGTLTVTPVALVITANAQSNIYGAALPTLTASYSGLVNGDTASSLTTQPVLTTTATSASHVSGNPYTITASGAVDADYNISYASGAFTVTPAPLSITANNQSKVYGAAIPSLTASFTGFVNGDTSASLTIQPALSTSATVHSHVSGNPYTIIASGAADNDYSISYVNGSLTVTTAALSITAVNQTKAYGAALPTLTVSYSGFANGDSSASLTTQPSISTTATATSHVSGSPYTITASGAADNDYSISYVAGTLTVNPVTLTITAVNKSKVYGAALPTLTASYSGFVNGDTSTSLTTQPTLSTTATSASHVSGSPYTITASGAIDADYNISYVGGSLTVTKAPLTITAVNQSKVYGAALPTLTDTYTGFVNGDTSASLTTQPTLATTATASSHVSGSPYSITASAAVDSDYSSTYVAGSLTVTSVPLSITANNQTKVYGAALAYPHGELLWIRQWRHRGQPHHPAHAHDDCHRR